jgi:hypothetical protein
MAERSGTHTHTKNSDGSVPAAIISEIGVVFGHDEACGLMVQERLAAAG